MPDNEDEAAGLLDACLIRADSQARTAQLTAACETGTNTGTHHSDLAL